MKSDIFLSNDQQDILQTIASGDSSKLPQFILLCQIKEFRTIISYAQYHIIPALFNILSELGLFYHDVSDYATALLTILSFIKHLLDGSFEYIHNFIDDTELHSFIWFTLQTILFQNAENVQISTTILNLYIIMIDKYDMYEKISQFDLFNSIIQLFSQTPEAYPTILKFFEEIFSIVPQNALSQTFLHEEPICDFISFIINNYNDEKLHIYAFKIGKMLQYTDEEFLHSMNSVFLTQELSSENEELTDAVLSFLQQEYSSKDLYSMFRFIHFQNQTYVLWNCLTSMIDEGVTFTDEENIYMMKIIARTKYNEKLDMIEEYILYMKEMNWSVVYSLLIDQDWIDCMINFVEEKEFKYFVYDIVKKIIEMSAEAECGMVLDLMEEDVREILNDWEANKKEITKLILFNL